VLLIPVILVTIFVVVLARSIRIIPQASAGIVERLGRYHRTLDAGLALIIPFIDRLRPLIDFVSELSLSRRSR
jgi:regulator of protease activity HflC (stomatin/prohibitin superfamily)